MRSTRFHGSRFVALTVVAVLAGCGVPSSTGVRLDGPAPQRNTASSQDGKRPLQPNDARSSVQLVEYFLHAAAEGPARAPDLLRPFLTSDAASSWAPSRELTVVRLLSGYDSTPRADGTDVVKVRLQPVGVLTDRGTIAPTNRTAFSVEFKLVEVDREARGQPEDTTPGPWRITNPLNELWIASDAFADDSFGDDTPLAMYKPLALFYWDTAERVLVQDQRYMSRTLAAAKRPAELVKLLILPPSDWLASGVLALPADTALRSNVIVDNGRVVVDLSAQSSTVDLLEKFAAQLVWSLVALDPQLDEVELRVEGVTRLTVRAKQADYPTSHPTWDVAKDPKTFCVVDGVVRYQCSEDGQLPVLAVAQNENVASAAVARDEQHAALVRTVPGGGRSLWVGSFAGTDKPAYVETSLVTTVMGRPVWLPPKTTSVPQGVVPADGRLYRFLAGSTRMTPIDTPSVGPITAIAVAPDARRVAFVAGGAAYVAVLSLSKADAMSLGPPRRLPVALPSVSAIGWSRPDRVLVLGNDSSRYAIHELTVTGVIEESVPLELGDLPVTSMVAYPDHPDDGSVRGRLMLEADGVAQNVSSLNRPEPMTFRSSRSPAPTPGPGQSRRPVAPFFLD